ncbi:MAG: hypothetical protein ACK6CP_08180 [Pseudanabaena sp.]|jgi:hypothetical protein|nr:hypothetical protein [Pseudanabaena sp. M090S1SP2A07QC]MCA6506944.1 hypothetical protein [Pseudanabaena sp. M172S2SP2A07QC]MCA6508929.1 hypothetical protein [Pseudanabaena sp. M109S1SP2A07QC]MCA6522368.1 hypothetical protein [Pseudanabaena sp. M051S1SP2A07QC]MCA6526547.1 hypothetical protein [Pseudanabaena sp. M179S2SP2A07QC]MCA6532294.1 hypothetical protein [Pseudanabaena sp. M125S2SP2A07QC]MCA6536112.1 hypothetical protein [Pseudanabaena sp. M176S2SP2A07QC]MCA6540678.1 hypothetical prot
MSKLIIILVLIAYVFGVVKFLQGFRRTDFEGNQIGLALLWPVLFAMNGNYRKNFFKALKGS